MSFLNYVAGRKSDDKEDSYVKKLEEAVKEAKRNREWRVPDIWWMSVWHGPKRNGERIYDVVNERSGNRRR